MTINCIRSEFMCPLQIGTSGQELRPTVGHWSNHTRLGPFCMSAGSQALRPASGGRRWVRLLSLGPYVDTAVDVQGLAGDVVSVFYQVAGGAGDLFGLAEAAEG